MKVKVGKDTIIEALQTVQSVINARSTIPILSNVLFQTEGNQLWMTATDLDIGVRIAVPAEVQRAGSTTLPAKRVLTIFRELPTPDIELDVDEKDTATVRCASAFFKIIGLSDEEFPPLPKFEGGRSYTLDQKFFKDMLKLTHYAASPDETRANLHSVLLSFKGAKLTVVATDGRRMALMEHEVEFPKDFEGDLVLPFKIVEQLLRALKDEGSIKISCTQNQVAFEFGQIFFVYKLVEAVYPNFRQVIPSQCEERVNIEREGLMAALHRVSLLMSEKTNSVKLTFAKNKLEISTIVPTIGEARESLAIVYSGKPINIFFNPMFMIDPLKNLVNDEVSIELTDDLSPCVIKSDIPFLYVLMPVRTG